MAKKWLSLTLCLAFFAFPSGGTLVHNLPASAAPTMSDYEHTLSVVTYNIRGCRTDDGTTDPALIISALEPLHADLIALQEVDVRLPRSGFVNQLATIAAGLNMNYAYGPSIDFVIGQYGNALLSKYPIQQADMVALPSRWEPRSLLDVTVNWDGEPLHVLVTHLGVKKSEHSEQTESLLAYLHEQSYKTSLLLGDFNMLPGDPSLEALRTFYKDPLYEENLGLRTLKHPVVPREIDRILHSQDLTYMDAAAPAVGPSDHYPVQMHLTRSSLLTQEAASSY
ncbi:endonuclease/exonuclease/phosphatase family protein [Brevibacillus nitrificans]|uniref:endonuclease/exonuclease/phosphatase family protein n=1 Tax=Brevibacillus nitrificans TaxID=651560 RepID=UPI002E1BD0BF|nr:endonuclease/exonuclease/phosphatase family protein [Brevibacillus nitrificans]